MLWSKLQGFACEHSPLLCLLGVVDGLISGFGVNVHDQQSVSYQIAFYELVEGRIGGETRSVVYLQQIALVISIDHKVKT